MIKVSLYDQSRDRTIELENSSTVTVGRGFFECNDKRVSRKHGEITVLEAKIKIKACHTNPIFYKINGSSQNQILIKDNEVELKNLDKFSLLPNSEYEYEIKIIQKDNPDEVSTTSTSMRIRNATEINENLETGNIALSLSQIVGSARNTTNQENERIDEDLDRTPSPDMLVPPPDFAEPSQSSENRKRSQENVLEVDDNSKRPRLSEDSEPADTTSTQPTPSDDVKPVTIKPDPDSVPSSSNPAVSSSSSTTPNIKPDPDGPSDSTTPATTVKKENPSDSSPAAPTPANPGLRPSCEYGIRCYRNTPDHHREFAHPSDPDYRRPNYPPAPATAPNCPWGAACYRRNPDHFRALQHPSSSVYSTQPQPNPQPAQAPAAPAVRRQVNVYIQDDSDSEAEDNYDPEYDFDDSDIDQDFNPGDDLSEPDDDEDEENNLEE